MWQFILQNPGLEELILNPIQCSLALDNDDFVLLRILTPKLEYFSPERCNLDSTGFFGESVTDKDIEALTDVNTNMKVIKFQTSVSSWYQAKILEYMPELQELHVGRELPGALTISPNANLHFDADSLRIWPVPYLYSLLHPTFTHSTKNLQELRIQMVIYSVNGLVELLRRVNLDLRVLDIDCFVSYPIKAWYTGVAIPLTPQVLDVHGALPQFNLWSL
ncbi:hypothetical protein BG000_009651 [Podila horticola]|nr:hypothetical protein BG000_009651 [Podila horticola]